jgi:predicted transcriptional regulator with HTH domain
MLSQLVLLFYTLNSKEANDLINSLLEKKIPFVEEFEDGSARLLEQDMPLDDRILLVLYNFYPNRKTPYFIAKTIMSSPQYVKNQMISLEKALLTHTNSDGSKLTKRGIEKVEKEILCKLEGK